MKKLIISTISLTAVSIQLPLIIACQTDNDQIMYERLIIINGVKTLLGLIDEKDSPNLHPYFDDDYNLVAKNNDIDFHDESFLNKTFLDDQKKLKISFHFNF